ncbi:hypothetical protein AB0G74_29610 [Streptomyces sp. NPDC020875]|uniref:hypothetical protein n=1 Tax=Streptomyces sp. NPDC020875 TaxID=3154898 RepID=UPI0034016197
MRRTFITVGTAAAIAAVLTGCGTSPTEGSSGGAAPADPPRVEAVAVTALPTTPGSGLTKGLTLPVDPYIAQPADGYVRQTVVQDQWRSCMAGYGFADFGPPRTDPRSVAVQVDTGLGRRYGVSDLASVTKYGYHLPTDVPEAPHWEPAPGAETAVFTGEGDQLVNGAHQGRAVPEGGCRGEARRMFPVPQSPHAERLGLKSFEASREAPAVVAAVGRWAACMKTEGYDRDHPLDDLERYGIRLESPRPDPKEIAHAVADVTCKERTGLIGIWHGEETARQRTAIQADADRLAAEKRTKDTGTAEARRAYETRAER